MAFHPSGRFAYVITEAGNTVTSYRYDPDSGLLASPVTLSSLPPGFAGKSGGSAHVVVAPSGQFVYGSNRGHDSIVIYAVDETTGRLTWVGDELGDGTIKNPRDFALSPDGRWLIVASQTASSVVVFRVDDTSGTLTRAASAAASREPTYVGIATLP